MCRIFYRTDKGVRKKDALYLGRVIDKDKHFFYNTKRGVFRYDADRDLNEVHKAIERSSYTKTTIKVMHK